MDDMVLERLKRDYENYINVLKSELSKKTPDAKTAEEEKESAKGIRQQIDSKITELQDEGSKEIKEIKEIQATLNKTENAIEVLCEVINSPIEGATNLEFYAGETAPDPKFLLKNVPTGEVSVEYEGDHDFKNPGSLTVNIKVTTKDAKDKDISLISNGQDIIEVKNIKVKDAPEIKAKAQLTFDQGTPPEAKQLIEGLNDEDCTVNYKDPNEAEKVFKEEGNNKQVTIVLKDKYDRELKTLTISNITVEAASSAAEATEANENIKAKTDLVFIKSDKAPDAKELIENLPASYEAKYKDDNAAKVVFNKKGDNQKVVISVTSSEKKETPIEATVKIIEKEDIIAETGKTFKKSDEKPEAKDLVQNEPTGSKVEYKDGTDIAKIFSEEGKKTVDVVVKDSEGNELTTVPVELEITDSGSESSTSSSTSTTKKGFFERIGDYLGGKASEYGKKLSEQWEAIWNGDNWKKDPLKNLGRTAGFAVTGVGLAAMVVRGLKKRFGGGNGGDSGSTDTEFLDKASELIKRLSK